MASGVGSMEENFSAHMIRGKDFIQFDHVRANHPRSPHYLRASQNQCPMGSLQLLKFCGASPKIH